YDYGANFTLNFCGGVVEELKDVVGVDEGRWRNVSAFYEKGGKTYSIGQQNLEPVFRGRKLVLNYTDGSPCPSSPSRRSASPRKIVDDDDDDDEKPRRPSPKGPTRRKSTVISLLCDKDPLNPLLTLSFVATSPDECTYFFEARSSAACGGIEVAQQQLGPGGVFGVIALIAVLVYLVGGCVYQRTVMHQRGWRQLPNYSLWAGLGGFFRVEELLADATSPQDIFIILTSSCARFLPSRRGYSRVGANSAVGRGRGRQNSDDENRLIDQLDEEWDDN
ncbi:hypothetical protein LTR28_013173, partial [Elasticomyces elasticus]